MTIKIENCTFKDCAFMDDGSGIVINGIHAIIRIERCKTIDELWKTICEQIVAQNEHVFSELAKK